MARAAQHRSSWPISQIALFQRPPTARDASEARNSKEGGDLRTKRTSKKKNGALQMGSGTVFAAFPR